MTLEIKEKDGVIQILGNVTSQNVSLVKNHLLKLLEIREKLLVSLEYVSSIDADSARFFEHIYCQAARNNKVLTIFGLENSHISETMRSNKIHYIFNPDRE